MTTGPKTAGFGLLEDPDLVHTKGEGGEAQEPPTTAQLEGEATREVREPENAMTRIQMN
jgi:hypothetical protein